MWFSAYKCVSFSIYFSLNIFQSPVSLSTLGVIHLLQKNASHPAGEKKSPSRFTVLSFSLSNYPFVSRGGDSAWGQACPRSITHKRALMLRWEDWKVSPAMGGSPGARTANTAGKKRRKRKREKIKQEIVRAKGKMLGGYPLIRSPFLWWSHLLREGEMRSVVQTLRHDPAWFHYCYWQCRFYNVPLNCWILTEPRRTEHQNRRSSCAMLGSALQWYLCEGDGVVFSCIETVREEIWCIQKCN